MKDIHQRRAERKAREARAKSLALQQKMHDDAIRRDEYARHFQERFWRMQHEALKSTFPGPGFIGAGLVLVVCMLIAIFTGALS